MADPLSITASVIAVVVLGVKSTKIIYETFSGLSNAHTEFGQAQNSVAALEHILEGICTFTNFTRDELLQGNQLTVLNNDQMVFFKAILRPLELCALDLKEIAEKVAKWQKKYPKSDLKKKFLGSIHHFIKTSYLQQIEKMVAKHLAIFNNHLTLAGLKQNNTIIAGQASMQATLTQDIITHNEASTTSNRVLLANEFVRSNQRNDQHRQEITTSLNNQYKEASSKLVEQTRQIVTKIDSSSGETHQCLSSGFDTLGTKLGHHKDHLTLQFNQMSTETTTHLQIMDRNSEANAKQLSSRLEIVGSETMTTLKELGSTFESHRNDTKNDNVRISEGLESIMQSTAQQTDGMLAMQASQEMILRLLSQPSGDKIRIQELENELGVFGKSLKPEAKECFDEQLESCLDRLNPCRESFIDTIDTSSEEVQLVLEDLLCILKSLLEEAFSSKQLSSRDLLYGIDKPSDEAEQRRLVKRVGSSLTSSEIMHVAATPPWKNEIIHRGISRTHQYQRFNTSGDSGSTVSLHTTTVTSNTGPSTSNNPTRKSLRFFEGSLTITQRFEESKRQQNRLAIRVAFAQRMESGGTLTLPPTISFSFMRPDNAEVFQVIRSGDIFGFRQLLQDKKASLTDRDSAGHTLLYHCIRGINEIHTTKRIKPRWREICKFLIENGAELDVLEAYEDGSQTLIAILSFNLEESGQNRKAAMDCENLLLEAGADLNLHDGQGVNYSYMGEVMRYRDVDTLRRILNCESGIIDLEQRDCFDRTALLIAVNFFPRGGYSFLPYLVDSNLQKIHLLLDRNANAAAQGFYGWNCLHILLGAEKDSYMPCLPSIILLPLLVRLINAGAQVDALDINSQTPRDFAKENGYEIVWFRALKQCGYIDSTELSDIDADSPFSANIELAELITELSTTRYNYEEEKDVAQWRPETICKYLIEGIKPVENMLEPLPTEEPYFGMTLGQYAEFRGIKKEFEDALTLCGYTNLDEIFAPPGKQVTGLIEMARQGLSEIEIGMMNLI